MTSVDVFSRSGSDVLGARAYYTLIGILMAWSLGSTALVTNITTQANFTPGTGLSIALLILPFIGIFVAKVENFFISFLGLNLVSIPFGVILAPYVKKFSPTIVQDTCMGTMAITVIMVSLAMLYPRLFSRLEGALFGVLLALVIFRIIQMFVPHMFPFHMLEWLSVGLFSLYIGFDWWRAYTVPKTALNAIDIALSLYLDVLNLFVNLLEIFGGGSDD